MSVDLAWAAGFFDGEGNTRFNRPRNRYGHLVVQISQAEPSVLERFQAVLGEGKVHGPYGIAGHPDSVMWHFCATGAGARRIIERIGPWLSSPKKQQAEIAVMLTDEADLVPRRTTVKGATHCVRGHDMTDAYVNPEGHRHCRQCRREAGRRSYRRRKVAV